MNTYTIDDIKNFLKQIEEGTVTLTVVGDESPEEIYCGNVRYKASNGWEIIIYNDCNFWDYIDDIITPDGIIDNDPWEDIGEFYLSYEVSDNIARSRYFIPNYNGISSC